MSFVNINSHVANKILNSKCLKTNKQTDNLCIQFIYIEFVLFYYIIRLAAVYGMTSILFHMVNISRDTFLHGVLFRFSKNNYSIKFFGLITIITILKYLA